MSSSPSVILSRQTSFSAGLRLRHPAWDEATNLRVFGRSARAHGAEFRVRVEWKGLVRAIDGMIVNLIEVKPWLAGAVAALENRFLDQEVEFFASHRPTAENVAAFLWNALPASIGGGLKHKLVLEQSGQTQVELSQHSMKVSRSYEFAAAHRLWTPQLSEQENWEWFDKCSNRAGHGHNFGLRVWIEGTPDPDSGYIINPTLLDQIVDEEVYSRFDHKHLNEDCPEFADSGRVPTSENLALVIFELLSQRLQREGHYLCRIGLQETQKNYFEVEA